jgi:two-component system LytT family response regulator
MKVVTIDDEKAMHLILRRMLAKMTDVQIVGSFQNTAEAFAYLADHRVDLIFVDISMPRETGLEFADRLRKRDRETKLVFITSHKEFALASFDVYAFDYIVKPVVQERLGDTVRRVREGMLRSSSATKSSNLLANGVSFYCLGGIAIQTAGGESAKWKSSKSMELFAYLLMNKGKPVSRARLIEDMFGHMPLKNAESYLNTTVYQLRKLLEVYVSKELLQSDSHFYALSLAKADVDWIRFEEGCKRLSILYNSNLQEALEVEQLYRGDLFGDHAYLWARDEVERLSLLYTAFTQQLCVVLLEQGEAGTAHRLLSKLLANNELDEVSVALMLRNLALQKQTEALTQRFEQFKQSLQQELGASPSSQLVVLYHQLLSGMPA